jgi:hypothetical protein
LINDLLVIGRDNTNIRELLGSQPEVSGYVYYELGALGYSITGISITNSSYEQIGIKRVDASIYSTLGKNPFGIEKLFPPSYNTIHTPDYGIAQPASSSGIITLSTNFIPYWSSVDISIWVISESSRYGIVGVSLNVNN